MMFKKVSFGLFFCCVLFNASIAKADTITVYTLHLGDSEIAGSPYDIGADTGLVDLELFVQSDSFWATEVTDFGTRETLKKISLVSSDSMVIFSDSAFGACDIKKSPALGLPSESVLTSSPTWAIVFELGRNKADRIQVVWYLKFE